MSTDTPTDTAVDTTADTAAVQQRVRRTKHNNKHSFRTYALRSVHERMNGDKHIGANRAAARIMDNVVCAFKDRVIITAAEIARQTGHSTIDRATVLTAIRLIVPREVFPAIEAAATKAADAFASFSAKTAAAAEQLADA